MPGYVIADVEVTDPAAYEEYRKLVPATVAKYGGRYLVRGGAHEVREGDWRPTRVVVLEFPSVADARRWYDEEHVKHLLAVPGFLSGARYVALRGGPKYLAMYELEEPSVLRTAAFLDEVRHTPSPWRRKASGGHVGRNYILNAYRQIWPTRTHPVEATMGPAPYLQMGRIDVPAAIEEEFNEWYNAFYIPGYLAVPGVLRARRFVVIDGQPKYLTVYEFEHDRVPDSDPWRAHQFGHPWTRRVRRHLLFDDGSPGVYRRIYPAL